LILYEDNHLLVVNKRPGEIVQGDRTGDAPLVETLKGYLREKYHKPGDVFLGLVHRLDRPVSGAVIFARTGKALSRMNELVKSRQIRKIYWAIVSQLPPANEGALVHYLEKNQVQNRSYVYDTPGGDRKIAELKYRLLGSSDRYHLLKVELLTGRHHQIRAQLASIGCPVRGDLKYGYPRSNQDGSICLHARQVDFIHPVRKEPIVITAPAPEGKLWEAFAPYC
jgi:23S rRNA pseudouridine1911/1915/1917 synthase